MEFREDRQCFLPFDAAVIKGIPLCNGALPDFWSWYYEKRGQFSVRLVYRMLVDNEQQREAWLSGSSGGSNSEVECKCWTKMRKVQVPSKLKVFLWCLAKQSLPTADLLRHRSMATTSRYTLCGAVDSWKHSLLECVMARSVWALCDEELVEHLFHSMEPSAKQWIFSPMEALSHSDFTKVLVTIWPIGTARCKAIHEQNFQSPISTLFLKASPLSTHLFIGDKSLISNNL